MRDRDVKIIERLVEEARCLRAVLERILRVMDEGLFVDYQMEKFGKIRKTKFFGLDKELEGQC